MCHGSLQSTPATQCKYRRSMATLLKVVSTLACDLRAKLHPGTRVHTRLASRAIMRLITAETGNLNRFGRPLKGYWAVCRLGLFRFFNL